MERKIKKTWQTPEISRLSIKSLTSLYHRKAVNEQEGKGSSKGVGPS